ncbi:filamentous hemagglutinin N-terminal domain-containing protein [Nostoc flagelliforme FACHB-838]|uniref:Filamentous hemagglutinin N-terminal domain-containing protein n=1 Tax=Nostoc flagelliforme FACHB-838 TaxID=2692904 RepID=A0ABR8DYH7_9NOSO|nr:filamentous hemagglutinin N-terminal domain-containing protein [Nostoc flagelliforme]MBD2534481.1 filamentous hemagglutinin N-terminal domain-containing protein [Nostoc flagelliforme FACHB-838]
MQKSRFYVFYISTFYYLLSSAQAVAQIVPDVSLPNNSQVTNQGNITTINEGTKAGNNLFHSFEKFSLTTGDTAYFNNPTDIQNIFSRVTGSSISNIDGILRANGTANLFLINPSGIIFGPNASLNLGGSFLASTANSINFADKFYFSATNVKTTSLLTISVPIGLQLGSNPGAIIVQGTGHSLTVSTPLFSPILGSASSNSLRVSEGKTLALIGGNVDLLGGILTAPGGRIEIGSVSSSEVSLNPTSNGWIWNYKDVQNFQDIRLSQQALVDASGIGSSSIHLIGKQISLADGSIALIQNQGTQARASINANALDSIKLSGTSSDGKIASGFLSENLAANTGDSEVSAKNLVIQNGAAVYAKTFTEANGSNIILNVSESTQIIGFSSIDPTKVSGIGTYTFSSGNSGNIRIDTGKLTLSNGATVISGTFGAGQGGNLTINANEGVQLSGFNPFVSLASSQLGVAAFSTGNAGILTVNAPKVLLQNGSNINSYTLGKGNAGNVVVNAYNSIDITRETSDGLVYDQPFGISSTAAFISTALQQLLGLPPVTNGNAGDVTINTNRLTLRDGTLVNVSNFGTGNAGNLKINANNINLDNSNIGAATASGQGGNIFLQANSLLVRRNSSINATSSDPSLISALAANSGSSVTGSANGGNIIIDTNLLILIENSKITANAFKGRGGNININALGFFSSPDSKITASSEFGLNGNIQINALDNNSGINQAAPEEIPTTPQITPACQKQVGTGTSSFVVSSRNPQSKPNDLIHNNIEQSNSFPISASNNLYNPKSLISNQPIQIIEANALIQDSQGNFVLTIDQANLALDDTSLSASSCFSVFQ